MSLAAQYLEKIPEALRGLGDVVRITLIDEKMEPLAAFLRELGIDVPADQLPAFRDALILRRPDLQDLATNARFRLRMRVLLDENPNEKTPDYRLAEALGAVLYCRDCRYFVKAPADGSPNGDKPCVAMGTKGADVSCYGFTNNL